jgi:FHS family glucose/mannose:H+ symporter-like MFS transporter
MANLFFRYLPLAVDTGRMATPETEPRQLALAKSPALLSRRMLVSMLPLAMGMLLAGVGTALLGPILPLLESRWHMTDSQAGTLLLAKFLAAFVGGITVSARLERSLMIGMAAGAVGFGAFACAGGELTASVALAVAGFGIGQTIAGTNILAGRLFTTHRGAALSALNLAFSLGAILSSGVPIWLTPRFGLQPVLAGLAGLFIVQWIVLLMRRTSLRSFQSSPAEDQAIRGLPRRAFLYFATLLLLYGAAETGLSAWLTTFATRFGMVGVAGGAWLTLLLWMSLTAGRGGASVIMLRLQERTVQRWSMGLATVVTLLVAFAPAGWPLTAAVVLLGLLLAPLFPATWALLIAEGPTAREAGAVLAASGIGAAALPWLMGVVSSHAGGLRVALTLPAACTAIMLAMSLAQRGLNSTPSTFDTNIRGA